ncbi:MAG: InlB B-repeat-containing protein [Firmicutes bacterium]|nr:InlB B-repeat-containing protein [Bacillota bacterium]
MGKNIFAIFFVVLLAVAIVPQGTQEVGAAAGQITDSEGNTYQTLSEAFGAASDGGDVTLTVSGDTVNAGSAADNKAVLTQNAKVTILAEGTGTTINGLIGVDGSGTLVIGSDQASKKINIAGGLFADSGTLETHSELALTSTAAAGTGAIRLGSFGATASITARINGGTITTGSGVTDAQSGIKASGSGTRVEYIKGITINSSADGLEEGAIAIDSDARVELIDNCTVASAENYALFLGNYRSGGHVTTIKDSSFKSSKDGIWLHAKSTVGDIKNTSVEIDTSSGSAVAAIHLAGKVGSLCEGSSIKMTAPHGVAVSASGGQIDTVDNVDINITGRTGAFGFSMKNASIGTISNSKINATSSGMLYGINMQPGRIDYIRNSEINIEQKASGSTFIAYQVGPVKEISGCTMRVTGSYATSCGYNVLNDPLSASDDYKAGLGSMKNTTIISKAYALGVQQDAHLGTLSGNHFYADNSTYGAIYLSVGGVIDEIKSGTYASKGSGVIINYGTRPGPSGERNSTLKKISHEEVEEDGKTVKQGPVFYGETGWAIRANTQGPAPAVDIEKAQVEADQPKKGYARYYGGASKTGGLGNGDAVIGWNDQDRGTSLDSYPEGYFMSRIGTDDQVADDVLKNMAGMDISGKTFHYLTIPITVKYDANGGTGDMSDKEYNGEYRTDLKTEENGFTNGYKIFTGWNTKADGSGKAYQAGDVIEIEGEETTLYAQWQHPGKIEVTFKIVHPELYRNDQSPVYRGFPWMLQSFYGGGAASLKDSTGKTVGSFSNEYRYTFDDLAPGEYNINLDVLERGNVCLVAGVHNGAPRSDILIWSEDSDKLHVTVPENPRDTIRRWVFLELKAYGFKTVTDKGAFQAQSADSGVPGAPSEDGKEYVYYAVREGGNNWDFDNPELDSYSYIPYVHSHLGIYHGESANKYEGMNSLQIPKLSAAEVARGYKFAGWKLTGDDSGKVYTEAEALAYDVRKHTTFEAVWEETCGSIKLGKRVIGNEEGKDKEFEFNIAFTDDEGVPMANKTFGYGDDAVITDENGVATLKLKDGEVREIYGVPGGSRYTITEKNYGADGYEEVVFKDGDDDEVTPSDVVAKAGETHEYTAVNKMKTYNVVVTDDGNGTGSASPSSGITGTRVAITAVPNEGYEFAGWQVISGGVLPEDIYSRETTFNIGKSDVEVRATFKAKLAPTPVLTEYTITYDLNGGEYNNSKDHIKEIHPSGATIKIHAAPTREGYTFLYWKGSAFQPGDDYIVNGDHTFTAQWMKDEAGDDDMDDPVIKEPDSKQIVDKTKVIKKTPVASKVVETGDEANLISFLMLIFASLTTMAALAYRR